jgi:hypothetical protein
VRGCVGACARTRLCECLCDVRNGCRVCARTHVCVSACEKFA